MKFVIVMEQGEDESWSVRVPDLPGCFSWGATPGDAVRNAREAIQGHIEVMREFGDPVPEGWDGTLLADIVEIA
jgi:predicted RNase H-like HicB family nuclease